MNDWLTLGAFMLSGAMFALMLLGLGVAAALPLTDRWSKRWFIVFFTILLIVIGVYFTDLIVYRRQDLAAAERAVAFSEFLFTSALIIMPTPYLLHCCGESPRICTGKSPAKYTRTTSFTSSCARLALRTAWKTCATQKSS